MIELKLQSKNLELFLLLGFLICLMGQKQLCVDSNLCMIDENSPMSRITMHLLLVLDDNIRWLSLKSECKT